MFLSHDGAPLTYNYSCFNELYRITLDIKTPIKGIKTELKSDTQIHTPLS